MMSVREVAQEKSLLSERLLQMVRDFNQRTGTHITRIDFRPDMIRNIQGEVSYVIAPPNIEVQVLATDPTAPPQ